MAPKVAMIGVNLTDVDLLVARTGDLLHPLKLDEHSQARRVSAAADFINARSP